MARDGPKPNHTFAGNKNTAAVRAETQTPKTATPQPIRSYIPPPAELERPGSYTNPHVPEESRGRMNGNPDAYATLLFTCWRLNDRDVDI